MILLYLLLNNSFKFILVYNLILFQSKQDFVVPFMYNLKFLVFNYFFCVAVVLDDFEYRLVNNLLEDYNALARPSLSHLDPTNVTFDLSLSQLIDVVKLECLKKYNFFPDDFHMNVFKMQNYFLI